MSKLKDLKVKLKQQEDKQRAWHYMLKAFKAGKGDYAERDIFLGVPSSTQKKIAKEYIFLSLKELQLLLRNPIHEYRHTALFILIEKYKRVKSPEEEKEIYDFYLDNINWVNNWDLVDITARNILGIYLLKRPSERSILYKLAHSSSMWKQRIAIVSTMTFIKKRAEIQDTLNIANILFDSKDELVQKATGWLLKEVGLIDQPLLVEFLETHYNRISRVTLRYALERFDEVSRTRLFYRNRAY